MTRVMVRRKFYCGCKKKGGVSVAKPQLPLLCPRLKGIWPLTQGAAGKDGSDENGNEYVQRGWSSSDHRYVGDVLAACVCDASHGGGAECGE